MTAPTRAEAAAYRSAGPSTLAALHGAIKARMETIVGGFWGLLTKSGERAPVVFDSEVPPKAPAGEQFPFVLVRPKLGRDSEESAQQDSTAAFDVVIGTYRDEDDGISDVLLVLDAIRLDVAGAPVFGGAFEHTGPLEWSIPEQQARPQWIGIATLHFTLPRPVRVEAQNPAQE